jgi:hypothetical protein
MARLSVPVTPTIVCTVAELLARFGSLVFEVAEIVSVICVPFAVPAFTCATTVKVAAPLAPDGMSASVQVITPDAPTAGVAQDQPAAPAPEMAMDWKFVLAGTTSVIVALIPSTGPLFITVWT